MIIGSVGMVIYATNFPFSSNIWELKFGPERLMGLNGYEVWAISWVLIILSGLGQQMSLLN